MLNLEDYQWIKDTFKKVDFFAHCSAEDAVNIGESMDSAHFGAGQTILMQGEFSDRLFLIRKGKAGIWKKVEGDAKKVAELGAGRYFGEISLLTPSSTIATVKAETDCDVLTLTGERLEEILSKKPNDLQAIRAKIEERKNLYAQ